MVRSNPWTSSPARANTSACQRGKAKPTRSQRNWFKTSSAEVFLMRKYTPPLGAWVVALLAVNPPPTMLPNNPPAWPWPEPVPQNSCLRCPDGDLISFTLWTSLKNWRSATDTKTSVQTSPKPRSRHSQEKTTICGDVCETPCKAWA